MTGEMERREPSPPASRSQQRRYNASRAGGLDPEWAMVGVDVPAGKRLYASQSLKGTAFEVAVDEHLNGQGWKLDTVMENMLVITKASYGECLAELMQIWQNWENAGRDQREVIGGPGARPAITGLRGKVSCREAACSPPATRVQGGSRRCSLA